ncbi:Tubulin polyglutamylase TTLL13 [Schistosoma japonicum]|nr:Tubulin polyglutamylase TTLL13 [Schistosoma japonicum]
MGDSLQIIKNVSPEILCSEELTKTSEDMSSDENDVMEDAVASKFTTSYHICQPLLALVDEENILVLPPEDQEEGNESDVNSGNDQIEDLEVANKVAPNKPETLCVTPLTADNQCCKKKRKKRQLTVNLSNCKYESVRRVLKRFGFRETEDDEDWCLYWTDYSVTIDKVLVMKQWQIWDDIDDVIIKTLLSGYAIIRHNYRTCFPNHIQTSACFEILGFDIMFNHRLKPYVLEVNHSPSFTTDSKLDKEIKEAMLWDTVQLANFTAVSKKKCCDEERKRIRNRLLHKNSDKDHKHSIEKDIERFQALSEKYENNHMGNFRLIYPSNNVEKYSPFLNPTASFYQETVTYKVRSECARQLREEIRLKQEKLGLITNKHKQSQSESPAPKRSKIKISTLLSHQLIKTNNNDDIFNNSSQLIPINNVECTANGEQNNQGHHQTHCECIEVLTIENNNDNNSDKQSMLEATSNSRNLFIDTKLPQPILENEEAERISELKIRERQMHKIGLISVLYELFAQHIHLHSPKHKSKEVDTTDSNNIEQNPIKHRHSQQQIDKNERALNVLKPTNSWKNRTQLLSRQKYWIKNQENENSSKVKLNDTLDANRTPIVCDNQNEKNKPFTVPSANDFRDIYSIRLNENRFINSAQPTIHNNPTFGAFPSHQFQKIQQQKSPQPFRVHSGNLCNIKMHSNSSSIINLTNSLISQNLPVSRESQLLYQNCSDTALVGVKSYQSTKKSYLDNSMSNSIHAPLRINVNSGSLQTRSIRSSSTLKSNYAFREIISCSNDSSNCITTSYSNNTSRQHSHNSSNKNTSNGCESLKEAEKYKTPLPTLVNTHLVKPYNNYISQVITNGLMPVVTSAKLNRVARRNSNQDCLKKALNE